MNREDSAKVAGWLDHAGKMARTVAEHNAEETIVALTAERDNALAALRRRSSQRDQLDARCEQLVVERDSLRAAVSSVRALHSPKLCEHCPESRQHYVCAECGVAVNHPCPTLAALDSSETPPAAPKVERAGRFEVLLVAEHEQFDQRGELLRSVVEYMNAPSGTVAAPVPEERSDEFAAAIERAEEQMAAAVSVPPAMTGQPPRDESNVEKLIRLGVLDTQARRDEYAAGMPTPPLPEHSDDCRSDSSLPVDGETT